MMRIKRPRATGSSGNGVNTGGHTTTNSHNRSRGLSEEMPSEDHLLHMDPSLMTERQQLAFLLRTTAQEGGTDSADSQSDDSDSEQNHVEEKTRRHPAKKRRIQSCAKSSPRNTSTGIRASSPVVYSGRGRPPKNAIKSVHPPSRHSFETTKLHVTTTSREGSSTPTSSELEENLLGKKKASPSSTSDILHMDVFEEHASSDFWSVHCALCCQTPSSSHEITSDALFLCATCDKKYPTQRTLGRV